MAPRAARHRALGARKRALDLVGAGLGLVLLAPVLAVTAAGVRVFLGSPVLFRHVRPGLNGEPFVLLKFRTMTDARGRDGKPLPDAERLTPFGRWLRRTSFDELPELLNVLKGEMSLVGPRPLVMQYLDRYSPEQARRNLVRPGLTGWAQVNGRNALSWDEKFRMDVWYVDNWSVWLDVRILLMTVASVLGGGGVSQPGHATAEEFMGSGAPSAGPRRRVGIGARAD
jgi:sugar transferase EpsL